MNHLIAVCDDEPEQARLVVAMAGEWAKCAGLSCEIRCFPSAEALWFAYRENRCFDILLLDVEMKGITGIALARRLRADGCRAEMIFITSHFEFAAEGYDVDALHYLLKPVAMEKLFGVLSRAAAKLAEEPPAIVISWGGEAVKLYENEILYAESFLHDLVIHTTGREYRIRENISAFEQRLSEDFFRTHRSYLVNLKKIRRIDRTGVTLEGGSTVPVARGKYDGVNRAFIMRN